MPRETVSPLLDRRLITGDRMMLAHVYLKKGCIVPKHSHENEQITYILEGALKFWIGEDRDRRSCRARRRSAAHSVERAAQGRSARGYARRRHLRSAAPGLAQQDRLVPAEIAHGSRSARTRSRSSRRRAADSAARSRSSLAAEGAIVVHVRARRGRARSGARRRSRRSTGANVHAVVADLSDARADRRVVARGARDVRPRRRARDERRRSAGRHVRDARLGRAGSAR